VRVTALLNRLGKDPGSLGRWIPDALGLIFRNCGIWAAEAKGENELVVIGREIPEPLSSHRLWLRSLGLGMKPLFMLCGVDGTSDLAEFCSDEHCASYRLSWKPYD